MKSFACSFEVFMFILEFLSLGLETLFQFLFHCFISVMGPELNLKKENRESESYPIISSLFWID